MRPTSMKPAAAVTKGDRVVFTNEDDVIHNIHIFGPGEEEKDLGLQKPGATLSYTFDKVGAYRSDAISILRSRWQSV
jgi:plastocyanin